MTVTLKNALLTVERLRFSFLAISDKVSVCKAVILLVGDSAQNSDEIIVELVHDKHAWIMLYLNQQ